MATPFSDIYELFLSNITDFSLGYLDDATLEETMQKWLINAIPNYPNPKSDLTSFNLQLGEFTDNLDAMEKVILAKLMTIEYINPFILDESLLKQSLNPKDYRIYSPDKHLETLQKTKDSLNNDVARAIARQSYSVKNLKEWFGKTE